MTPASRVHPEASPTPIPPRRPSTDLRCIGLLAGVLAALSIAGDARSAEEIQCGALAPVVGRACAVESGSDGRILIEGDVLGDGQIHRGGGVLVESDGTISCTGCDCAAPEATRIRCPESVVSPGLINGFDHITYAQNPPALVTDERYEHRHDWRVGANGHNEINPSGNATADQIRWHELRQLISGTTSAVAQSGQPGLIRNLDNAANQGLGIPTLRRDTFPLGDSNGATLTSGCGYPNIRLASTIASDPAYLPVVGEGIDAAARNEFFCTDGSTPGGQDLLQPQTALAKGLGFTTADFETMKSESAGLIWSPRSNLRLYGDTARVSAAPGLEIALATDWLPTGSMNMLRELRCANAWNRDYLDDHFSQEEIWQMATRNAASLTGTSAKIGTLTVGRVADLAVFDASIRSDYDAILNADPQHVLLVMRGGKILFGEELTVLETPGIGFCDPIDVCGSDRAVCLVDEIGKSFAQLQATGGTGYSLFFCGDPIGEPPCSPLRGISVDGSTTYDGSRIAGDQDGDGIADGADNCPTVFNPVRPLDAGSQQDFDADGVGDECDPTPVPEPSIAIGLVAAVLIPLAQTDRRSRRERRARAAT